MQNSHNLFIEMEELWTIFSNEHNGTSTSSKTRARKAIGDLKKLITDYRRLSTDEETSK